jgi:hypothetical protein
MSTGADPSVGARACSYRTWLGQSFATATR